jgi:hypothetical protein
MLLSQKRLPARDGAELKEVDQGGGQSSSGNQHGRPVWKNFWRLPIPHKVLIFGWRVAHCGLATQRNKRIRNITASGVVCTIWGMADESKMHALIHCEHAQHLRSALRQEWPLPDEEQFLQLTPPQNLLVLIDNVRTDMGARALLLLWLRGR